MTAAAIPRVSVLGGGIAGCAAASRLSRLGAHVTLVEMGRGPGGRAATRRTREDKRIEIDHGASIAEITTPAGLKMAQDLADRGWSETVSEPIKRLKPGTLECSEGGLSDATIFKGKPSMSAWCEGLLDGAQVARKFGSMVRFFDIIRDSSGSITGWRLLDKDRSMIDECDWLVVTGSGVAHSRWTKTFGGTPPLAEAAMQLKDPVLDAAIAAIEGVGSQPVQAAMLGFDGDAAKIWSALPFSMVEIDGDETVAKIIIQRRSDMVFVVVHSTHQFAESAQDAFGSTSTAARVGGASADGEREQQVLDELVRGLDRCLSGFSPRPSTGVVTFGPLLHRWGNAFPRGCIASKDAFAPSSHVVFAGDYVGQRSGSIEGAMLSGSEAAEMLMSHVNSCS